MFKTKLSLLLIAIFLLNVDFLLSYPAIAGQVDSTSGTESAKFTSRFNSDNEFSLASNPNCGAFETAVVISGIAIAISALWTGIVLIVSSMGWFTAFVVVGMIATLIGIWKSIGGLVVCQHSFVRHPVARDENGDYKDFQLLEPKYREHTDRIYTTEKEYFKALGRDKEEKKSKEKEEDILNFNNADILSKNEIGHYYWPKNAVQFSDYIEVCNRNHLTFGKILKSEKEIKEGFDVREIELGNPGKGWAPQVDGDLQCKTLRAGQSAEIHGSTFKATRRSGELCVELESVSWMGISMSPWPKGVNMGCTNLPPDPKAPMCDKSKIIFKNKKSNEETKFDIGDKDYKDLIRTNEAEGKVFVDYDNKDCFKEYVSEACYNQSGTKSLTPLPITSMLVQCIKESLDNLVAGKGSPDGKSFLSVAQERLKKTVTALLVLALVLFSLKVMSGGVRSPQEMYMLIIKFALVVYFTTGNTMPKYYDYLTKLSNGLSEIVLKASSESQGICDYNAEEYIKTTENYQGKTRAVDYSYLAPWDRLDCRILFYLGAPIKGIGSQIGAGGVAIISVLIGKSVLLLFMGSFIMLLIAGGQVLAVLVVFLMSVFLIMIVLWMCYVFILSLVALSVIVILSPLFIPMVLFQHTKGYFDGWVKELITYSLYPVMLFAFLSFMFIACDKIFYKGLKFEAENLDEAFGEESKKRWFKLKEGDCDKNEGTLACMLQKYDAKKNSVLGIFSSTYWEFQQSIVGESLKLALVLFLFYHFFNILPQMAAELAGNHRAALGSGSTPGEMAGKALSLARVAAGDATEMAKLAAKKLKSTGRSSGPKSGGDEGKGGGGSESTSKE